MPVCDHHEFCRSFAAAQMLFYIVNEEFCLWCREPRLQGFDRPGNRQNDAHNLSLSIDVYPVHRLAEGEHPWMGIGNESNQAT